jgi:predicted DCC family thiol-disulfide oxidoreductase YuxK
MNTDPGPQLRILFDGYCGLCSRTVHFFLDREATARFVFTPIQSPAGRLLAARAGLDADDPASFAVFDEQGQPRLKSAGAFHALRYCSRPWPALSALCRLLPRWLCDAVYDQIARRRLRFFGSTDICALAGPELRSRLQTDASTIAAQEHPQETRA